MMVWDVTDGASVKSVVDEVIKRAYRCHAEPDARRPLLDKLCRGPYTQRSPHAQVGGGAGDDTQVVANTVVNAATITKPNLRYPAGKQSGQVRALRRYLSQVVFDRIICTFNEFPV